MTTRLARLGPWLAGGAVLAQSQWAALLTWRGEQADVGLAMVVLVGLLAGNPAGLLTGLCAGLVMGWCTGLAALPFVLSRGLTGAVAGELRPVVQGRHTLSQVALVAGGVVLVEVSFALLHPAVLQQPGWLERLLWRTGYTALLTPPLAWLLSWLTPPEERPT